MSTDNAHGYGPYTRGCRCEVCRRAKADYMRRRRQAGRAAINTPQPILGVFHGSRYAYEERGCRCELCTAVHRYSQRVYAAAKRKRAA